MGRGHERGDSTEEGGLGMEEEKVVEGSTTENLMSQ